MLTPLQVQRISGKLRMIQIISAAILSGALFFGLVIGGVVDWKAVVGDVKMLTLIGAMTGFMMLGLSMIVPRLTTASPTQIAAQLLSRDQRDLIDDDRILAALVENQLTNQILFSAIIEGAIFLNLITFLIETSTAALVVVAIGFLLLVFAFPLTGRLLDRLEQNLKSVREEMQLID